MADIYEKFKSWIDEGVQMAKDHPELREELLKILDKAERALSVEVTVK